MTMDWIRDQLRSRGWKQGDLADRIGMSRVMLTKMLNGHREAKADEVDSIRRAFGYALPEDGRTIPVIGVTRADGVILPSPASVSAVLPPSLVGTALCAAQVRGGAVEPVALDGDLVIWNPDDTGLSSADLGRAVVAQTEDGRMVVKRLGSGTKPGMWSLMSINPALPNEFNVALCWASRILMTVPCDKL